MDLDGFVKLVDAQRNVATTQASVANTMADVATKVANLSVIAEQAIKARLDNIAKYLSIQWDVQAHKHLLKTRNQALRNAKKLETEAKRTSKNAASIGRLLTGAGSATSTRDAWIAFEFFRNRVPVGAAIALGKVKAKAAAYKAASWGHATKTPAVDVPKEQRSISSLWQWAEQNVYYPKSGSAAWDALADYLQVMDTAAATQAAALRDAATAAEKDARELAKLDWDRLTKKT